MLRRLVRDKWAYFGLALLGGGIFLLTGCSSDIAFTSRQRTDVPPGFLGTVAEVASNVPGLEWLKPLLGAVTGGVGGLIFGKRAVNAYVKADYTPEEKAEIKAIAAEKPSA